MWWKSPRGGTWVAFCWVCAACFLEHLLYFSQCRVLPLSFWILEKSLDNGWCFLRSFQSFWHSHPSNLVSKLEHYGMALGWVKSYFSCHKQFVQFNPVGSPMQSIKCCIPQGSILGPLLFILYINDLPNASELTHPLLLAEDTSIFHSHSRTNCSESVLNDVLQNIDIWLKCNKLSVNTKTTNNVIFNPDRINLTAAFLSPLG